MKKVYVIDSNYPEDHYHERTDGIIVQHVLRALGIRADLKLALDRKHFEKAIARATKAGCDVLHISPHGNDEGIAICNDVRGSRLQQGYEWPEFVGLFQGAHQPPTALVMAACQGASSKLAKAFSKVAKRPTIIVGSTDERYHADYVAAWALLYRHFRQVWHHPRRRAGGARADLRCRPYELSLSSLGREAGTLPTFPWHRIAVRHHRALTLRPASAGRDTA